MQSKQARETRYAEKLNNLSRLYKAIWFQNQMAIVVMTRANYTKELRKIIVIIDEIRLE